MALRAASSARSGRDLPSVPDTHSPSRERGVVRRLHFQRPPAAHGKLVRVVRGAILDVAADIREGSATCGPHVAAEPPAASWRQLRMPRRLAHGVVTLAPDTEALCKVDAHCDRVSDAGILRNDPTLGIGRPVPDQIVSAKDRNAPRLAGIAPTS
jgi:dTDP-4-dehydrorhamnose 3,5-epimerase